MNLSFFDEDDPLDDVKDYTLPREEFTYHKDKISSAQVKALTDAVVNAKTKQDYQSAASAINLVLVGYEMDSKTRKDLIDALNQAHRGYKGTR